MIPFDLAVPAPDAFYVAARNDVRAAPIAKVFIDWIFDMIETERAPRRARQADLRDEACPRPANAIQTPLPALGRELTTDRGTCHARRPFNPLVADLSAPPVPSVFAWARAYDGAAGA